MLAKELMRKEPFTIGEDEPVASLIDVLVREHIHGLPVLDRAGMLSGMVTQQDVFFATVTRDEAGAQGRGSAMELKVRDIMTSPAVSAGEETELLALCRMMVRLRIHRMPIVKDGKITGVISSLDVCAALASGALPG